MAMEEAENSLRCQACGQELREGSRFCTQCGAAQQIRHPPSGGPKPESFCRNCDAKLSLGSLRCSKCGAGVYLPRSSPQGLLRCEKCDASLRDDYRFCTKCGSPVKRGDLQGEDQAKGDAEGGETASASGSQWFYVADGTKFGPINRRDLGDALRNGGLNRETPVWHQGMADWKPAYQSDLWENPVQGSPPPLPASHVDNRMAWAIAFVPLIGILLERIAADSFSEPSLPIIFLAYFAAYCVLALIDIRRIEKGGYNPRRIIRPWFFALVFIVPVYLYKRARALGQSLGYFWAWIAAFVAAIIIGHPSLFSGGPIYWGIGVPACDSSTAKNLVKTRFKDIPLVHMYGVEAVDVTAARETKNDNDRRTCTATVRTSVGNDMPVYYTIEQNSSGQIYIRMDVISSVSPPRTPAPADEAPPPPQPAPSQPAPDEAEPTPSPPGQAQAAQWENFH